jgi:hypothetical protein
MAFLLQKTQTENSVAFFLPVNIVAENKKPLISQRFLSTRSRSRSPSICLFLASVVFP